MGNSEAQIGDIIRYIRINQHISQAHLCDGICSRDYLMDIEANKKTPSLYIINGLSEKFGVNLLSEYNTVLKHRNLETHAKIEEINDCLVERKLSELKELVSEYEKLPEFKDGEPFQIIMYAKAVVASTLEKKWKESISYSLAGINSKYPSLDELKNKNNIFSNVELNLMLHIAVNLARCENFEESDSIFSSIRDYLNRFLSNTHYYIEKNYHFTINLLGLTVYNQYLFTQRNNPRFLDTLDETIRSLQRFKSSAKLFELLLCRADLLANTEKPKEAKLTYNQGHSLGLLYVPADELKKLEKIILSEKALKLLSEKQASHNKKRKTS